MSIVLSPLPQGMSDLAPSWVKLAPKWTNLCLFKISFLFILAPRAKMNRKLILKSHRFVPFDANLVQMDAKSAIPAAAYQRMWRHHGSRLLSVPQTLRGDRPARSGQISNQMYLQLTIYLYTSRFRVISNNIYQLTSKVVILFHLVSI